MGLKEQFNTPWEAGEMRSVDGEPIYHYIADSEGDVVIDLIDYRPLAELIVRAVNTYVREQERVEALREAPL